MEVNRKMDMNSANIEEIVKQVLAGMSGNASAAASAPAASGSIPKHNDKPSAFVLLRAKAHLSEASDYPLCR